MSILFSPAPRLHAPAALAYMPAHAIPEPRPPNPPKPLHPKPQPPSNPEQNSTRQEPLLQGRSISRTSQNKKQDTRTHRQDIVLPLPTGVRDSITGLARQYGDCRAAQQAAQQAQQVLRGVQTSLADSLRPGAQGFQTEASGPGLGPVQLPPVNGNYRCWGWGAGRMPWSVHSVWEHVWNAA